MTLPSVPADQAIDKATFHRRLLNWLAATVGDHESDPTVGPVEPTGSNIGRRALVHVRDERGNIFALHADVRRSSVLKYLELAVEYGAALTWTVVPNQRGNENAVAYGPEKVKVKSFYLYLVKRAG